MDQRLRDALEQIADAPAVHQRQRRNVLLHAILVNFEILLRQVGDELVLIVPGDDVGGDVIDRDAERGLAAARAWGLRLGAWGLGRGAWGLLCAYRRRHR